MLQSIGAVRNAASAIVLCLLLSGASVAVAGPRGPVEGEPKKSYGAVDVIMYQTSWWPYCNKAREFLRGMGVSLTEYDIEKDLQKREEMMAKSGSRGVPVIDVEGTIIRGYSPDAMKDAIERARRK